TCLRHREEPLVHCDLARAAALRARDRSGAGSRSRAVARVTGCRTGKRDGNRHALDRVVEADADVGLEVGAAARTRPGSPSAGAAEHPAEQIAQIAEVFGLEANPTREAAESPAGTAGAGRAAGPRES